MLLEHQEEDVKWIFARSASHNIACVAGENGEGERTREKNEELGARGEGTPATKAPFFHFCGRHPPQNSDWLIFDSPRESQ